MPRTLRGRLATWIALAVMAASVLHAGSAVFVFLLHERDEAEIGPAATVEQEEQENRLVLVELAGSMAIVTAVAALGAAAIGLWLSGKALAPMREAAERAQAARSGATDLLLPQRGVDDEWDRLAAVVNELLVNQRRSTERARTFSANAAHELRTPLTAMLGEIQVTLRRERGREEYKEVLTAVESEVARLAAVVDALLMLARADSGELRVGTAPFDVGAVALEVARARRLEPAAVVGTAGAPVLARGDPVLTYRVLDILVDNALRHGGKHVKLRVDGESGVVAASVADDGPGLPAAVRARLFERFNREPGASEGHGLGLAIAHAFASAQGGTLRLDDRGPPTRFVLELARAA